MKASLARTIKAILGKRFKFFGLRYIVVPTRAVVREAPASPKAEIAFPQDGGNLRNRVWESGYGGFSGFHGVLLAAGFAGLYSSLAGVSYPASG
jgi:hypothetical protein